MPALLRTELLKLVTTRTPWLVAGLSVALTLIFCLQATLEAGRSGAPSIGTAGATLAQLDAMLRGSLVALVLGVLVVTTEYRYRTVATTLLMVPHRGQVVLAKAMTAAVVGVLLGLASLGVVVVTGLISGALTAGPLNTDIVLHGLGLFLTYPLYALLGTGVGALLGTVPSLAVLLPLAWVAGLEGLAFSSLPRHARAWTVEGATAALQNAGSVWPRLPMWLGAGVLCGFVAALLIGGAVVFLRRDVT
ncbi:ABC transporter permease [Geodermatophilus sp. SYSU D01176]